MMKVISCSPSHESYCFLVRWQKLNSVNNTRCKSPFLMDIRGFRKPEDVPTNHCVSNEQQGPGLIFWWRWITENERKKKWKTKNTHTKKTPPQKQQRHQLTTQPRRSALKVQVSDNRDGSACFGWQPRSIWRRRRHKHKLSKGSKVDFNQLKGDKT